MAELADAQDLGSCEVIRKGSTPFTRTMQSVLIGSEYPVMDTLLFYFPKSSYRNLFRGVAECYAAASRESPF